MTFIPLIVTYLVCVAVLCYACLKMDKWAKDVMNRTRMMDHE